MGELGVGAKSSERAGGEGTLASTFAVMMMRMSLVVVLLLLVMLLLLVVMNENVESEEPEQSPYIGTAFLIHPAKLCIIRLNVEADVSFPVKAGIGTTPLEKGGVS